MCDIALRGCLQGGWGFYWREASIFQARKLGEASIREGASNDARTVYPSGLPLPLRFLSTIDLPL